MRGAICANRTYRSFFIAAVWVMLALWFSPCQVIYADNPTEPDHAQPVPSAQGTVFLPLAFHSTPCSPIDGIPLHTLSADPPPTDRPAPAHPDLNLAMRGYVATDAYLGLIDYSGDSDRRAPQLPTIFGDLRSPEIAGAYRVYDWDWSNDTRGTPISSPPVTMIALSAQPGEVLHVPESGYDIGNGLDVLVLYASNTRLTLKYTRDDNVIRGYTIHLEDICVDSQLLALYQRCEQEGREALPALDGGQPLGRASSPVLKVCIRDSGRFMDPRSAKDWWGD